MMDLDTTKAMLIRAHGIRQQVGVATVVLGSGHCVSIAKSVQLLGIDREYGEAALEERFHQRSPRHLNRDGYPVSLTASDLGQVSQERANGLPNVIDPALSKDGTSQIQHAGSMKFGSPVETNVDRKFVPNCMVKSHVSPVSFYRTRPP